jgi:fibronectin type 3 domain-containing protein
MPSKRTSISGIVSLLVLVLVLVAWPAHTQGTHSIAVSWTAPTTGGAPASYNVKRSTSTGTEATIASVPVPTTTYVDTNGIAGTKYFYVVSAVNQFGESPNSSEVSATFLGDKPGAPGAPSAVAQ